MRKPALPPHLWQVCVLLTGLAAVACGPRQGEGPPRGAAPPSGKSGGASLQPVEIGGDGLKPGLAPADEALAARVKEKLAADPRLQGMRLEVDAQGGRVTLWGRVESAEARAAAEQLARQTPGVKSLKNLVELGGGQGDRSHPGAP